MNTTIFGSDSEEEGEDEEGAGNDMEEDGGRDNEDKEDDDEDYSEKLKSKLKKIAESQKKKKKKSRRKRKAGSDDEDEGRPSKKRKSRKRKGSDESGGEEEREEGPREPPPKSDFDEAMDNLRKRYRRKHDGNRQETEAMVQGLLDRMRMAAAEDDAANKEGRPALAKLKLLPDVVLALGKTPLHELFLDNKALVVISKWLAPLPDGGPLLRIKVVTPDHLKDSGLGRTIMRMTRDARETADNKKMARKLVHEWSRPIFGLSASYRDLNTRRKKRDEPAASQEGEEARADPQAKASDGFPSAISQYRARIPRPVDFTFVNRPTSQVDAAVVVPRPKNNSKQEKLKTQMQNMRRVVRKNQRALPISIEGRGLGF
eukprot:CAMPEP_0177644170 /NCGR_PEP_ID=MMETSP0447-20121125/8540_1 /TAXON_ID=0 /ORGANISM="Stygamoeba regulata, Strain BSH-02190019" /LENGTH=372 /DNA_ID=CAMNT_0019146503 /DNA_START=6 /DNA_END=1124 /DNA_ORIENTATION=+